MNPAAVVPFSLPSSHPLIPLSAHAPSSDAGHLVAPPSLQIDPDLNMVKGGGGALLREKMVEVGSLSKTGGGPSGVGRWVWVTGCGSPG